VEAGLGAGTGTILCFLLPDWWCISAFTSSRLIKGFGSMSLELQLLKSVPTPVVLVRCRV